MDNRFKYHISVTEIQLPIRLGLDIFGTMEDLHYDPLACKYQAQKARCIRKTTLSLKKLIADSLKENVKPIK